MWTQIQATKVIVTKTGRLLLENKTTNPPSEIEIRGEVGLNLFSDRPINLYELNIGDFKIFWRRKISVKVKDKDTGEDTGEVKERWTGWQEYPSEQVSFQGRARNISKEE